MAEVDTASENTGSGHELPHIPLEILQKIAAHLDRKSALALTWTCKGLRDAGETRLWTDLDITSGWDEPIDERGFPLADPGAATWLALQKVTHDRCSNALLALKAYEYRAQCVRTVRLEPSDGVDGRTARAMMGLLTYVAPYIKHLDIIPLPWGGDDHPTDVDEAQGAIVMATEWFDYMADQVPCKYKLTCPRLQTLRIGIPTSHEELLPYIINRVAPSATSGKGLRASESGRTRLLDLRIESSNSSWPESFHQVGQGKVYKKHWKTAPLLDTVKSLTFGDIEGGTSSDFHMIELLSRAPNIEVLRLLVAWGDSGQQASCWKAIAKLKKLKSLLLFSADGLDEDFIGRQPLQIEELVRDDAELDEQDELSWTTTKLPNAPKLQRLLLITARRPPLSDYVSLGISRPAVPLASDRISSRFEYAISHDYPKLTSIQLHYDEDVFPSMYRNLPEPTYLVPPERWEAEGYRGMVIRSFDNPTNPSAVLYHIRALSRSVDRVGETYVGVRRVWRDLSRYRGRTVPVAILDKVYAAAATAYGAKAEDFAGREWFKGKRGIRMDSSKAWSILEEWRNGVDDDSDIESSDEEDDTDDDDEDENEDEDHLVGLDDDEWEDAPDGSDENAQIEVLAGDDGEDDGAQGGHEADWETDSDDPIDSITPSQG